jgi:hypothetical protein
VQIDLTKATTAEANKQRKQITMITIKKSFSLLSAIEMSVEYSEIIRTTFVGAFSDLSTQLHELGADWDYTGIDLDDSTMYDVYGTYEGSEFRIYVTCFFPI